MFLTWAGEKARQEKLVAKAAMGVQERLGRQAGIKTGTRLALGLTRWARRASDSLEQVEVDKAKAEVDKAKATSELKAAMPGWFKSADPERLGRAIAVARKFGVDTSAVQKAEDVVESWNREKRDAAKKAVEQECTEQSMNYGSSEVPRRRVLDMHQTRRVLDQRKLDEVEAKLKKLTAEKERILQVRGWQPGWRLEKENLELRMLRPSNLQTFISPAVEGFIEPAVERLYLAGRR